MCALRVYMAYECYVFALERSGWEVTAYISDDYMTELQDRFFYGYVALNLLTIVCYFGIWLVLNSNQGRW